jgi:NAD-dependent deacetylase
MPRPTSRRLVLLTGAGISRESGLHTFRDPDGIWASVRMEDVATPDAFARDPARVNEFYNHRRRQLLAGGIEPNAAHVALARLEAAWDGSFLLVTQNVDDLHERAGSRQLIHLHGELLRGRCAHCGATFTARDDLTPELPCSSCARTGGLRPDVVWFGELPYELERIYAALRRCDVFAAIGTSGTVYPAAQFVAEAAAAGAHTVELNLAAGDNADAFADHVHGPATQTVPRWVEKILASP